MNGTIISFCDLTGTFVADWLAAGFDCWIIDMQHPRGVTRDGTLYRVGADIHELHPYHRWLPQVASVHLVAAWPTCTHNAYSGQRWRRDEGPMAAAHGFMLFAVCWNLCRFYERERDAKWMIEQPDGWVCSWCAPDYSFDPFEYGDAYAKHTNLWTGGGFVMPPKVPSLFADEPDDRIHQAAPGPDRANIRSATPAGFAAAVFASNQPTLAGVRG